MVCAGAAWLDSVCLNGKQGRLSASRKNEVFVGEGSGWGSSAVSPPPLWLIIIIIRSVGVCFAPAPGIPACTLPCL